MAVTEGANPPAAPAANDYWVDISGATPALKQFDGAAWNVVSTAGVPATATPGTATVIDFPDTAGQPTDGSFQHTAAGRTWSWNGFAWRNLGTAPVVKAHDLEDLDDTSIATLPDTDVRGVVVRDDTINDGAAGAFRVLPVLDFGEYKV